jgi:hypothetical protein
VLIYRNEKDKESVWIPHGFEVRAIGIKEWNRMIFQPWFGNSFKGLEESIGSSIASYTLQALEAEAKEHKSIKKSRAAWHGFFK